MIDRMMAILCIALASACRPLVVVVQASSPTSVTTCEHSGTSPNLGTITPYGTIGPLLNGTTPICESRDAIPAIVCGGGFGLTYDGCRWKCPADPPR